MNTSPNNNVTLGMDSRVAAHIYEVMIDNGVDSCDSCDYFFFTRELVDYRHPNGELHHHCTTCASEHIFNPQAELTLEKM